MPVEKIPPPFMAFNGKRYIREAKRMTQQEATKYASSCRKSGSLARIFPVKLAKEKTRYWIYTRRVF